MRRAAVFLLVLLALGAVAEASKLGDAIKERLDDLPKVTAQDGGRPLVCPAPSRCALLSAPLSLVVAACAGGCGPASREAGCSAEAVTRQSSPSPPAVAEALTQLHDSIQDHIKDAAEEYAKKRPSGVVASLLGSGSRRRLQTIGVVSDVGWAGFGGSKLLSRDQWKGALGESPICHSSCGSPNLPGAHRPTTRPCAAPPPNTLSGLPRLPVQLLWRQLDPVRPLGLVLRQLRLDQPGRVR